MGSCSVIFSETGGLGGGRGGGGGVAGFWVGFIEAGGRSWGISFSGIS